MEREAERRRCQYSYAVLGVSVPRVVVMTKAGAKLMRELEAAAKVGGYILDLLE